MFDSAILWQEGSTGSPAACQRQARSDPACRVPEIGRTTTFWAALTGPIALEA
jgi:hypothetical protein